MIIKAITHDLKDQEIENTKKLIDALRSGDYKQTKAVLKLGEKQCFHCCLGVGCDIMSLPNRISTGDIYSFSFEEEVYSNVPPTYWWIDTYGWHWEFKIEDKMRPYKYEVGLHELNDKGVSFNIIADIIEAVVMKKENYNLEDYD